MVNFMVCVYSYNFKVTGKERVSRALERSKTHCLCLWYSLQLSTRPLYKVHNQLMQDQPSWGMQRARGGGWVGGRRQATQTAAAGPQTLLHPGHQPRTWDVSRIPSWGRRESHHCRQSYRNGECHVWFSSTLKGEKLHDPFSIRSWGPAGCFSHGFHQLATNTPAPANCKVRSPVWAV